MQTRQSPAHEQPAFIELFTPKLITVFREGYGWRDVRADAVSGLTVAVVALPLSMAIAIASGVSPERGLYTAIAGGLIISLIGGSRFQIGGPAGAFIGLVAGIVERHGYDGLALATVVAGLILISYRTAAPRHLHQIHSFSGHRGVHRRHCRNHRGEPDP
jgi:sulfate permease, SulP family